MRYANIRPHADQTSGVAMFRPVSVLGEQFMRRHDAPGFERQVAARALELARFTLEQAELGYAAACADLGAVNRRRAKKRHDRAITSDRTVARLVRECFGVMNRQRGALVRARKALAAAETAVAKLAH
jgi:hypothetical protein